MLVVRRWLSVVCVGLLVVLGGPVVEAQEQVLDPTVVVLDASGSMTEVDADGVMRMDAAKQAVDGFLSGVPVGSPLGLVTYGTGTGSSDAEKEAGCRDISVLSGVGEKPVDVLKQEVGGLVPRGYTPIGNALLRANELLPKEGARSIVLVSDGIDTCAPPPVCEVAQQLEDQGTELVVHTIGFMVDEAARAELECVAQVTGGTYADASTADSLSATLKQATTRTAAGYQFPSETVEFGRNKETAPTIKVGTLEKPTRYHATIPPAAETENESGETFAKVEIPEGYRLQVGYTLVPELGTARIQEGIYHLFLTLEHPENNVCTVFRESADAPAADQPDSGGLGSELIFTQNDTFGACSPGEYYLQTNPGVMKDHPKDMDLTLALVPEPTDFGDDFNKQGSPERRDTDLGEPAAAGEIQTVQPQRSATASGTGYTGSVELEIVEGETQYIPTPVGWGQALDVTAEIIDDPAGANIDMRELIARELNFDVINPLGQGYHIIGETTLRAKDIGKPVVFGTKYPISFTNGTDGRGGAETAWLGGTHLVQVSFTSAFREAGNTDATTELQPVKYRLTFSPVGQEVAGPTFPTGAPTISPTDTSEEPQSQPQAQEESGGMSMIWWIAIVVVIMLLVLLLVIVALLSKKATIDRR